jgi:hypothetical protein
MLTFYPVSLQKARLSLLQGRSLPVVRAGIGEEDGTPRGHGVPPGHPAWAGSGPVNALLRKGGRNMAKLDERQFNAIANVARSGNCQGFFTQKRLDEVYLRYHTPYVWVGTAFTLTGVDEKTEPDARDTIERAILLHAALVAAARPDSY